MPGVRLLFGGSKMSKNRNYIAEIISKRARLIPETNRVKQVTSRTLLLGEAFNHVKLVKDDLDYKSELLKYFPIGTVACIESYFRLVYRDLIDFGPPFSARVIEFKDLKFSVETVIAIHTERAISLGEFISHLLPTNNLDDINKNMSLLIGDDFLWRLTAKIKNTYALSEPIDGEDIEPYVYNGLKRLYELRHIFCHELGTTQPLDVNTAEHCLLAGLFLIMETEELLKEFLPKGAT
jgi:hypothetical protein